MGTHFLANRRNQPLYSRPKQKQNSLQLRLKIFKGDIIFEEHWPILQVEDMPKSTAFERVVDLTEALSLEEKETLLQVLRQRTIQQRRKQLTQESRKARKEFRQGLAKPTTSSQLMREIKR